MFIKMYSSFKPSTAYKCLERAIPIVFEAKEAHQLTHVIHQLHISCNLLYYTSPTISHVISCICMYSCMHHMPLTGPLSLKQSCNQGSLFSCLAPASGARMLHNGVSHCVCVNFSTKL